MAVDIELKDLSKPTAQPDHASETATGSGSQLPDTNFPVIDDGVIHAWAWASALLLLVLAVPLILSPRLLLFLSETSTERRVALTPLESFMAFHTGILVFAIALALVFNIPSDPMDVTADRGAPGHPLLGSLSVACVLISFISYNTKSVGPLGFLVFLGSGAIGLWGLWALLFSGSAYVSRKTGADKRTSRFLFGNKAAASVQKKEWKRGREGRST